MSSRDEVSNQLQQYSERSSSSTITTSNGCPVDSITASLTAGPRGTIPLKDFVLIDHLAAFDRERIPERVVHAKGAGAFGYFEVCELEINSSIMVFVGHLRRFAYR